MVAKITSPNSIRRALNYNEQKVQKGQAVCLHAGNFLKDATDMNFYEKLNRFQDLIALNDRAQKSNTLHISLNFDPSEKIAREKLVAIADSYMEKIGFGAQPYLVYEHRDAGHPHIHIVTTNIEASGKRIDTYNIGKNQSEKARKEIETAFGLVKATGRSQNITKGIESLAVHKIEYGKSETKRSITNVLDQVVGPYKYTSLAALNAILKGFNVVADRGQEGGRIHKHNGLMYHILDDDGKKVGVPIKASSIYSKPTLANLEKRFIENQSRRSPDLPKLKKTIDLLLAGSPVSLPELIKRLQKENVQTVLRSNDKGFIYGISFVDHRTKSVFNGSEIGKSYSAAGLQKRLGEGVSMLQKTESLPAKKLARSGIEHEKSFKQLKELKSPAAGHTNQALLLALLKPAEGNDRLPYPLLLKRRKRKRKRIS